MFSNVTSNQIGGKSGRPLPGFNHYTGLITYGTAPSVTGKWKTYPGPPSIKAQQLFSALDGTNAGIIPYTDNTAASGTYQITTPGAAAATLELVMTIPTPNGGTEAISLGVYTVTSNLTAALQATDYKNLINTGTVTHGFTATSSTDTITITAPKKYGKCLNSGTPISTVITGAFIGSIVQFSAGTASPYAIWDYHIRRFFKKFPKGVLWFGIISAPSSFNEIYSLQVAAGGKMRQIGIYDTSTSRGSAANITGTILSVGDACKAIEQTTPLYCYYSPNLFAVSDLSTLPDQNLNKAENVGCVISQDGDAEGATLFVVNGQSIGNIGDKLATLAASRVSASDAQPTDSNNLSDGVENNVTAFSNGQLSSSVTLGIQEQLDTYRYTLLRQFSDEFVGSYWTDNKSCVIASSDFANANDKRTIQMVQRIIRTVMIPKLHTEAFFNDDNTLADFTIEFFKTDAEKAVVANMITGYGATPLISGITVDIDPTQKVKSTGNLTLDVEVNQNGIVRNIAVNISYKAA